MASKDLEHSILGIVRIIVKPRTRTIRARIKADTIELFIPSPKFYDIGIEFINANAAKLMQMKHRAASKIQVSYTDTELKDITKRAKIELPQRVDEIAQKYGFRYTNIGIRNMKSRWGSCSSKGEIHLSVYLMQLPQYLVDFVIIHELCHTRHMNHSDKFWKEVEKIYPNYKELNKELKNYHTR